MCNANPAKDSHTVAPAFPVLPLFRWSQLSMLCSTAGKRLNYKSSNILTKNKTGSEQLQGGSDGTC